MESILHDINKLQRIIDLTSETLILISGDGVCLDVRPHTDLWFLQRDALIGKNILELLPSHTYHKLVVVFQEVLTTGNSASLPFRLPLGDKTYFAECKLMRFDDNVLCQYTDITNRENVKAKLTQAYEEMQEMQSVAQIGKWKLDTETNIIGYSGFFANDDEPRTISITLERYMRFIIPEDREKMGSWLDKMLHQPSSQRISFRIKILSKIYYISVKCICHQKKKQHKVRSFIEGIVQNVTEMHKRRNDINMLTHVIFNANESIYGAYTDGTLKFANQIFRRTHHIGIDDDIAQYKIYNTNCGFAPNKAAWDTKIASMENKLELNFLYNSIDADTYDDPTVYEGKFYKMTEDTGDYSYWAFGHDVTDRVRYESEMKRNNQLLSTIFNNIPVSISVKDIADDYRFIYRHSLEGEGPDLRVDMMSTNKVTDFDIYSEDDAWTIRREDMKVGMSNEPLHAVIQGKDNKGKVTYFDILKQKISDPNFSPMILCLKWDITPIESMKRRLEEAKKRAEESDKLKTIFLANISHEIRTPLNAIVGFSNIMVECENAEQRDSFHKIIDQSTKRLLKFVNEIMLLSRIESGEVKLTLVDTHLLNLCNEVYDYANSDFPSNVELVCETKNHEDLIISADEKYLTQVFMILIKTSLKFIDNGKIWFGFKGEDDWVEFYVKDNGKGLVNENKNVFSLFNKYNYGNDGSDLELTICHALIQLMGGSITAESKKGIGSKFTFKLPRHTTVIEDNNEDNETK
jgi:signal transduction histidine kinase